MEKLLNFIQELSKRYPQGFNEGKILINKCFFSYPQNLAALPTTTINIYTYNYNLSSYFFVIKQHKLILKPKKTPFKWSKLDIII